ncbi:MAG: NAD(P)/FAD-dependent oxidoreductase [Chloroflexi bacterium]|nr:NAD(P)/FAD-dependent oxidoreductase [Chloroflexota bacterium]
MTGKTDSYDVIIIGAGPAGSQIAYKLAGMGHSVGVVERKESLKGAVCCTGLVSWECVDEFSIPENVIYRWVNSAKLFLPSGKPIQIWRDVPQVAVLNRSAFNQAWAERAQKVGAEYLFSSDVRGIERGQNKTKIIASQRGEMITLQSRVVVVTTGFGSHLLGELDLGGVGDFVMGAQTEVETKNIDEIEVYFGNEIAPAFFAWLVPTLPGKALVGLLSRYNPPAYLRKLLASLSAEGKLSSADVKLTYGGVPLKPLPHTHDDSLLVVGTAAGQVKPITGGGIYFGLMCADIAVNTLHRALETDNLSASGLAGYERTWRRKLGRELTTGYWARKVYEMLGDRQVDRFFRLLESRGMIDELRQAKELSFDWHAGIIARVMGQKLFARAASSIKKPFNFRGRPVQKKKR